MATPTLWGESLRVKVLRHKPAEEWYLRYLLKIFCSMHQVIHTNTLKRKKHLHTSLSHTFTHTHTHEFLDINTFLHVMTGMGTALTSQDRYTCAPVTLCTPRGGTTTTGAGRRRQGNTVFMLPGARHPTAKIPYLQRACKEQSHVKGAAAGESSP